MKAPDVVEFASRALAGHGLRTGLSMLGVAIGVAAVIMLTALGEGARRYVVDEFAGLGANILAVVPGKTETTGGIPGIGGVPHDLTLQDAEALRRRLLHAELVVPVSMGTETVSHGERSRSLAIMGTTHEMLPLRNLRLRSGRFLPAGDWRRGSPVVVLGSKAARELFPATYPVGEIVRVGDWRMRVIGVMAEQGVRFGVDMDDAAIVPVSTGLRMFDRSSLFRILIRADARTDVETTVESAVAILTERHGEEDVTVVTPDAMADTFSSILSVLTLALAGIAAISLSVAGLGIMNVMLVSVSERTSEVGLLVALGARRRHILLVFLVEAMLLSTVGGVLGLAAGWGAIALLVQIYPVIPASPPAWAVASSLVVSLAVGTVFGVLPARQATRLEPVAALSGARE